MNFEPEKFFIGLMDFFSILLPGALLTFLAGRVIPRSGTGYVPCPKGLTGCRKDKGCVSATRNKRYGRDEYPVRLMSGK